MEKLNLNLVGLNGNAFALLGHFAREAKKAGWDKKEIDKVFDNATSDDYGHLLRTLMSV